MQLQQTNMSGKIICPKCNGKNIMARIKTDELYCRRCGYVGKREEFFKGEIKDIKI